MKQELIAHARALGGNVYQSLTGQWIIKVLIKDTEILLQEQKPNEWLLVSNQIPQALLKVEETDKPTNK